ncbi:MAG: RNA-binding S4 domain-containing protein [Burkholderiaceae bacterium]|nr:RNA-binding S4 domain-containing protein [Burkholderiaceae bacterium]
MTAKNKKAQEGGGEDKDGTDHTLRLDKWLWAARFYKTRSLAADEIDKGRIAVNGQAAKPSRTLRPGDLVEIRQGPVRRTVQVLGLSAVRGPAPAAQALYEETADSLAARQQAAEARRLAAEPALAIAASRQGRPTKRDRRDLGRLQDGDASPPAWQRWSASLDPDSED